MIGQKCEGYRSPHKTKKRHRSDFQGSKPNRVVNPVRWELIRPRRLNPAREPLAAEGLCPSSALLWPADQSFGMDRSLRYDSVLGQLGKVLQRQRPVTALL